MNSNPPPNEENKANTSFVEDVVGHGQNAINQGRPR